MAIPGNIQQYLFQHSVPYTHKTHSVAYTAQEVAHAESVSGSEFAKAVVLQADDRLILAALPADHVINLDVLKRGIHAGRLSLALEKQFADRFPGSQPGAMPPFGKLYGLPLYCDRALTEHAEIEFNAGTHTDVIRMKCENFVQLENPRILSFSEKCVGQRIARSA